jgi:hypothetical protein
MNELIGSVGRAGKNAPADVTLVQGLVNECIGCLTPGMALLRANGTCDGATIDAITAFQRRVVGLKTPDGRVDPGGPTFAALLAYASGKPWVTTKKYTGSPHEVAAQRTTPAARDVVAALLASWAELHSTGARTLAAQFLAETCEGKHCFNWNLGNVKASADEPHMYLQNVWECFSQAAAKAEVQAAGGLARIADADEVRAHGWSCPAATVVYQPPHAMCRFRAYGSLGDGAQLWLQHHQKIAQAKPAFLTALNAGDVAAVAHALKLAAYYTAPEDSYANAMKAEKLKIDKALGPLG